MKRYTVKVTKKDIANGIPCDTGRCPVALALRRATGNPRAWAGGYSLFKGGNNGTYNMNKRDRQKFIRFVEKFDDRKTVRPITLNIVDEEG